jgi:zinc protease
MRIAAIRLTMALSLVAGAQISAAQTADEVIEKSIAAIGGRDAFAKIKSRSMVGTIVLGTPAGDITGSLELLEAPPNKVRTLIKADLTSLGAGPMVMDQRFDGHTGYALDTLQGNRDITGNQLDNMKNGSFPHPFLNYKSLGTTAQLTGKEKVGDRDALVVTFDPTSGSTQRHYIDAVTFMPLKMVMTVNVPQVGQDVEQTTEFLDVREVDGIKTPFRLRVSSSLQSFTVNITKVEHNVKVDESLFVKPATP